MPDYAAPKEETGIAWGQVAMAAVLMLATLPGRTQGLGLITEPMLADLRMDRITYAQINLWATLLGSPFCLPAGWLVDRYGLRGPTVIILLLLTGTVWAMSAIAGGAATLFLLVLLTRSLGQSALSVASITTAGRAARDSGMAMGVYSVLLSVLFAGAFVVVGGVVSGSGWRVAWREVALGVLLVAMMSFFFLPRRMATVTTMEKPLGGVPLMEALRTPVFWVFGGAIAFFGLVSSGIGLFNEAVLAERGFDQKTYHTFLAVMAMLALAGQFICGWLSRRWSLPRLLGIAMFLYAAALAAVPLISTRPQLWVFACVFGFSGGMITVIFFAVWGKAYGRAHLGRIQGAAQMLAVFASALGPLVFASTHDWWHSYTPLLPALGAVALLFGIVAWNTKLASSSATV